MPQRTWNAFGAWGSSRQRACRGPSVAALDDAEQFEPMTLADWERWLKDNHDRDEGVWLVTHKKSSPQWSEEFTRAVPEALRFG